MAGFFNVGDLFAFITGNNCIIHNIGSETEAQVLKCDRPSPAGESDQAKNKGHEVGEENILACGISPRGTFVVACDDFKQIWVWTRSHESSGQWTLHSKRDLGRRCTSLAFTKNEDTVLVADKSGDVFSFPLRDKQAEGQLLLGHVSMLLDVVLCGRDDNFVVTCDRDEKIRVSHYPNAYNIQSYCLGHTEFVSQLAYFEEEDLLVSGGGDCTLKIWNFKDGKVLYSHDLSSDLDIEQNVINIEQQQQEPMEQGTKSDDNDGIMSRSQGVADVKCLACCQRHKLLAVGFDKQKCILLYKLESNQESSGKATLVKTQKIQLSGDQVWDIGFDQWDNLWYLEPIQADVVHIMRYDHSKDLYLPLVQAKDCSMSRKLMSIKENINSLQQELFKSCFIKKSGFELLHKVKIDNMSDYLERKQNRLHEKAQKRQKKKEPNECELEDKLMKTSD